uniref:Olfactory binding protein n=1 Tax=Rhyparobia maderae TaxID=36963 RepID=Q8MTC2_RHYMA|nr:olfactory binding protein [Rhyparobia maderae]
MASVTVFLFAACVALVGADLSLYDFSPVLLESHHSSSFSRVARSPGGPHDRCCQGSGDKIISDQQKSDMEECAKQYGVEKPAAGGPPKGGLEEMKKKMACAGQCLGQKQGLLDSDNYVDVDKFSASVAAVVTDSDIKALAEETAKKCAQEANEKAKASGEVDYNGTKCNLALGRAMMCVHIEVELNCPDDKKVKSDECDKAREHMKKMKEHKDS